MSWHLRVCCNCHLKCMMHISVEFICLYIHLYMWNWPCGLTHSTVYVSGFVVWEFKQTRMKKNQYKLIVRLIKRYNWNMVRLNFPMSVYLYYIVSVCMFFWFNYKYVGNTDQSQVNWTWPSQINKYTITTRGLVGILLTHKHNN